MAVNCCSTTTQFEDAATRQFEHVARVSSPSWARIGKRTGEQNVFSVESVWNQRDLVKKQKRHFKRSNVLSFRLPSNERGKIDYKLWQTPCPTELSNFGMVSVSPSQKFLAVLKNESDGANGGDKKQYLEIWQSDCLIHCVKLCDSKKHGTVYDDATFGVLEWSTAEDQLLFIAERHRPKAISYFDKNADTTSGDGDHVRGAEHLFYEDWGELLTGHHCPVPVVFSLDTQQCQAINDISHDLSVGQAIWGPNGEGLVFVGWDNKPRRLGLIYCSNRKSAVYYWNFKDSTLETLSATEMAVASPRLSPDENKLVYLQSRVGGPHRSCVKLMLLEFRTRNVKTLVDVVDVPDGNSFPGLYVETLPTRCWSQDGSKVVFSSIWQSRKEILCVDVLSGSVCKISPDGMIGCWSVFDVFDDMAVFSFASPISPPCLMIGQLSDSKMKVGSTVPSVQIENIITIGASHCHYEGDMTWEIISLKPSGGDHIKSISYEAVLIKPATTTDVKPPMIVTPHGGPHSCYMSDFMVGNAALCLLGFAVLSVNYRGSIGFGQASIDALLGNVGTMDVHDVQEAAVHVIQSGVVDSARIVVHGGSHGGFLSAHLIGQFPDSYMAACVRNPAIGFPAMAETSDIPDWNYTESGLPYNVWTTLPSAASLAKMFDVSPIQYADKVKAPVLFLVGAKDLRCPPSQSHELHYALKARHIETKMLVYHKSSHPLWEVDVEADAFVNMAVWFYKHLYSRIK